MTTPQPAGGQVKSPRYAVDLEARALQSRLPWFRRAVEKRVASLVQEGHSFSDARTAALLRMTCLDLSTEAKYASAWKQFLAFCSSRSLLPVPAAKTTGLAYITYHAQRGTVHRESLTGYLSALNCAHCDLMFPPLFSTDAKGRYADPDVRKTLAGMGKAQGRRMRNDEDNDRLYLPAALPLRLLKECSVELASLASLPGLRDDVRVQNARNDLAVAFAYADFGRSQSQAGFNVGDVAFEASGDLVWQFRKSKSSTKNKRNLAFRMPAGSVELLLQAFSDWLKVRAALAVPFSQLWRLPWETETLVSANFNDMLQCALSRRGLSAPKGFIYTGHSTRAGALSEGNALSIPISTLRYLGGFAVGSSVPEQKYIDPSCPPSPAGQHFFGWLRPPLPS